jgi:hypothetical protein
MARGNARQKIVRDEADRQRLIEGLEQAVIRYGWELACYVVMDNHRPESDTATPSATEIAAKVA